MTSPNTENSRENGIWFGGTGARESEVTLVERATRNLGNLMMRVVDDPQEARGIVLALKLAELQRKYPDGEQSSIEGLAATDADFFVRNMQPSVSNSQDPLRLIRVESTDDSPVLPHVIAEEIKFRVKPGLAQAPITTDEVLYTTLHPTDPSTLLG